jgi:hypothetical protein
VRSLLQKMKGVARVLDRAQQREIGIDHERSGAQLAQHRLHLGHGGARGIGAADDGAHAGASDVVDRDAQGDAWCPGSAPTIDADAVAARDASVVLVDAPLAVAEARDPKGLYKRARAGELERFTGVSDPYEVPEAPDLRLATDAATVESCVTSVVALAQRLARPA